MRKHPDMMIPARWKISEGGEERSMRRAEGNMQTVLLILMIVKSRRLERSGKDQDVVMRKIILRPSRGRRKVLEVCFLG